MNTNLKIRKTQKSDVPSLMAVFDEARKTIKALGIDQWQNGYPSADVIFDDIEKSQSYCVEIDGEICATFAIIRFGEPTYDSIYGGKWLTCDEKGYLAIHRVAISVKYRGRGISTAIIDFAIDLARELDKKSLRIDTHQGNIVMRKMLEKHDFSYCGLIYLENRDERVAYEKIIG